MDIWRPADDRAENRKYLDKVKSILVSFRPGFHSSNGPAQILDFLYIGNRTDALEPSTLRRLKITHVLNCAAQKDYSTALVDNPYDPKTGVKDYMEFEGLDNDGYPILMHFHKAKSFIDQAKKQNGRVLVHCEMGVNRSGAICAAYVMVEERITLFQTLRRMKIERPVLLVNEGFQMQLIEFAKERGLLNNDNNN